MSILNASRATTLADVVAAINASDLTQRRREDLASAVRTVARVCGRPLDEIPADPRSLAAWLAGVAPAAHGISQRRWNNVRSLLRAALALVRPMMAGRLPVALSSPWLALYERLQTKSERTRLSPLLRSLGLAGVDPSAVTLNDLERYRSELMTASLRRNPESCWSNIVRAWNRAAGYVEGWPDILIQRESRQVTYTRPWSEFEPSLKADVDCWLDRLAGKDFTQDGPARPARASTLITREYQLRAAASALVLRGRDPGSIKSLADLVAPEAFKEILKFFYERNGSRPSSAIHGMAGMLKGVARHWDKCDDARLIEMAIIVKRLAVPDTGLTRKNRERLRPFDDETAAIAFVDLPFKIHAEDGRARLSPLRAAVRAQMAAAIALLIISQVRRQNLASIELDRHLVRAGRKLHLVFPAHEVKNGQDLEFEIPEPVAEIVNWYIEKHRPKLLRAPTSALFPGNGGKKKCSQTLAVQISRTVFRETGLRVNTHLFRHIGAKLFLDRKPGEYEVVRRVLAHKRMDTTSRFYAGSETKAATRHFDSLILGLRSKQPDKTRSLKRQPGFQAPGTKGRLP